MQYLFLCLYIYPATSTYCSRLESGTLPAKHNILCCCFANGSCLESNALFYAVPAGVGAHAFNTPKTYILTILIYTKFQLYAYFEYASGCLYCYSTSSDLKQSLQAAARNFYLTVYVCSYFDMWMNHIAAVTKTC